MAIYKFKNLKCNYGYIGNKIFDKGLHPGSGIRNCTSLLNSKLSKGSFILNVNDEYFGFDYLEEYEDKDGVLKKIVITYDLEKYDKKNTLLDNRSFEIIGLYEEKIRLKDITKDEVSYFEALKLESSTTKDVVPRQTGTSPTGGGGSSGGSASYRKCNDDSLKVGCGGDNVEELQNLLIKAGYNVKGGADGKFGRNTKAALIEFQKDNNLSANGVADSNTLDKLKSAPSKPSASSTRTGSSSAEEPETRKSSVSQDYVPDALGIQQTFWLARELFGDMGVSKEDMTQAVTVFDRVIKRMRTEGDIITAKEVRKAVDEVKSQYPDLFSGGITENLQKEYYLNPIKDRYNKIENLVFERLVKNAN